MSRENSCIFSASFGNPFLEVMDLQSGRKITLFTIGGMGYVGLELLWRGWSHGSMFWAGGTAFLLLGGLEKAKPRLPLPLRAVFGAMVITSVELLWGLLFNRNYGVWDYRNTPMNFYGQICLPYALLWVPVSVAAMVLYRVAEQQLQLRQAVRAAKRRQGNLSDWGKL